LTAIETLVDDIITDLAAAPAPFGAAPRRRNRKGEDELQAAMHAALLGRRLTCRRELDYTSFRFMNKRHLKLDIAADDLGLELKHVACTDNGRPHDAQAFPYDVILDCARLETLIRDGTIHSRHGRAIADGMAIGLTNDARIWDPGREPKWWSKKFRLPDRTGGQWADMPRRFFEVVVTPHRQDVDGAVYVDERYHVRLADRWQYRWRDFPADWKGCKPFRCLLVRRVAKDDPEAIPPHIDPLTVVPFASEQDKLAAMRHRLDMLRKLHERRKAARKGSREHRGAKTTKKRIDEVKSDLDDFERQLRRAAAA